MFQRNVAEKIKTHSMFKNLFPNIATLVRLCGKKQVGTRKATDNNIKPRMRHARWINAARHITCPLQQWLLESAPMLPCMLFTFNNSSLCSKHVLLFFLKTRLHSTKHYCANVILLVVEPC